MKILAIGNSFSQDATRYLYEIAKSDGYELVTVNLYIGGCELEQHYRNMIGDQKAYSMEFNGQTTGFFVSIKEALLSQDWDYVTLQQASHKSTDYNAYIPYICEIVKYVKKCVPKAKIAIHQTWAYETGSQRIREMIGVEYYDEMFEKLEEAYNKAADVIKADIIIPSGALFKNILESGVDKIHRDTFHASFGLGRYALGLLWYATLTERNIKDVSFNDFDEYISKEEVNIAKECVSKINSIYH